jgi:AAA15 family ATPase/GTPase
MLVEFSVSNFLSFKDRNTLNLTATPIKEYEDSNLFPLGRYDLLKGAIIYGANASGKSNFIKAMSTMKRIIFESFEQSSTAELDITPFLLSTESETTPTLFEVVFIIEDTRYRYGFEVSNTKVEAEWLFEATKKIEKPLFLRDEEGIEVMKSFAEGKALEPRTRNNALFLSVVDQFNGEIAKKIMHWFNNFNTISGLSHEGYKSVTFAMLENPATSPVLKKFYKELDLGFEDISISKKVFDPKELPSDMPETLVKQLKHFWMIFKRIY